MQVRGLSGDRHKPYSSPPSRFQWKKGAYALNLVAQQTNYHRYRASDMHDDAGKTSYDMG